MVDKMIQLLYDGISKQRRCKVYEYPNKATFFAQVEARIENEQLLTAIDMAYRWSKTAFEGIFRDSGERYFEHTKAVAWQILISLEVDDEERLAVLQICSLLHDLLEDTYVADKKILRLVYDQISPDITKIISDLTKDKDHKFDRLIASTSVDTKIIKGSDRWHNLSTISGWKKDRIIRKVRETEEIILPWMEKSASDHHVRFMLNQIKQEIRMLKSTFQF
jgi:(p)ppGpp synthase/HD superfamily hydrolase